MRTLWLKDHALRPPRHSRRIPDSRGGAHLHDVEEDLLSQAVLAFEELVLGVGAGDVSADELLARRRHLQQLGVLVLHRHVGGVAQQLPDDGPKMVRDSLPDQLLEGREGEIGEVSLERAAILSIS